VKRSSNPVDQRPFQSRSDLQREQPLETHYRSLAIPEVVAALRQLAARPAARSTDEWRQAPNGA